MSIQRPNYFKTNHQPNHGGNFGDFLPNPSFKRDGLAASPLTQTLGLMADRIHTYFSYDGETELPEEGVADFNGQLHYFWLRQCLTEPRNGQPSRVGKMPYLAHADVTKVSRRYHVGNKLPTLLKSTVTKP